METNIIDEKMKLFQTLDRLKQFAPKLVLETTETLENIMSKDEQITILRNICKEYNIDISSLEIDDNQTKTSALITEVIELRKKNRALVRENLTLKENLQLIERESFNFKQEYNSQQQILPESTEKHLGRIAFLTNRIDEMTMELDDAQADKIYLMQRVDELQKTLQRKVVELDVYEEKYSQLQLQLSDYNSSSLSQKFEAVEKENKLLREQAIKLRGEIFTIQNQFDDVKRSAIQAVSALQILDGTPTLSPIPSSLPIPPSLPLLQTPPTPTPTFAPADDKNSELERTTHFSMSESNNSDPAISLIVEERLLRVIYANYMDEARGTMPLSRYVLFNPKHRFKIVHLISRLEM